MWDTTYIAHSWPPDDSRRKHERATSKTHVPKTVCFIRAEGSVLDQRRKPSAIAKLHTHTHTHTHTHKHTHANARARKPDCAVARPPPDPPPRTPDHSWARACVRARVLAVRAVRAVRAMSVRASARVRACRAPVRLETKTTSYLQRRATAETHPFPPTASAHPLVRYAARGQRNSLAAAVGRSLASSRRGRALPPLLCLSLHKAVEGRRGEAVQCQHLYPA